MSLQALLDPDFLVPALAVTYVVHRMDLSCYKTFKDTISYLKEDFKDAQFWESYTNKLLSEGKLSENNSEVLDSKQKAIKRYKALSDRYVPKFFFFSRPFFYFKAKKEISHMGEEIERRLKELKAV